MLATQPGVLCFGSHSQHTGILSWFLLLAAKNLILAVPSFILLCVHIRALMLFTLPSCPSFNHSEQP